VRHAPPATELNMDDEETLQFASQKELARWLARHHDKSPGMWLKLAKKAADTPSVTYAEAVEVALCWGWIDGQKRPLDARFWLQRFVPRRPRSNWSKINCDKAEKLISDGKMQPPGLAQVATAKADGRWERAYDSPSRATVPPDLQRALDVNKVARAFFATLDGANRYAVLYRVQTAKRAETRARRIATLVAMLGRREKLH
jgi:uncharacterized protein YdeI (YjbR/CyaY-like superfamily)